MRALVLSDVHANMVALEAVLAHAAGSYDEIWNLGDTVGYGPHPIACLERLDAVATIQLAGNHDLAAAGVVSAEGFNPVARAANEWTAHQLTYAQKEQLAARPGRVDRDGVTLAHGSPRDPIWEYVIDAVSATANLLHVEGDLCFVGHSHVALAAIIRPGDRSARLIALEPETTLELQIGRMLINPGSVGQPRDGDPRAAYVIYDSRQQRIEPHRVPYDINATQEAMRAAHLPERLINRLASGR
ncbi:MAG: metallophosphoesterase family protein [Thermomicrobiales bacterium]|nr:metallophosphoesterase family protein [Thermomicrobiales bacterium]